MRRQGKGSGGGGGKVMGGDRSRRPGQGNEEKEEDREGTVNVAHYRTIIVHQHEELPFVCAPSAY